MTHANQQHRPLLLAAIGLAALAVFSGACDSESALGPVEPVSSMAFVERSPDTDELPVVAAGIFAGRWRSRPSIGHHRTPVGNSFFPRESQVASSCSFPRRALRTSVSDFTCRA